MYVCAHYNTVWHLQGISPNHLGEGAPATQRLTCWLAPRLLARYAPEMPLTTFQITTNKVWCTLLTHTQLLSTRLLGLASSQAGPICTRNPINDAQHSSPCCDLYSSPPVLCNAVLICVHHLAPVLCDVVLTHRFVPYCTVLCSSRGPMLCNNVPLTPCCVLY